MERISVIGAGLIGSGVAQVFAQRGYPVRFFNRTRKSSRRAMDSIRENLETLRKGKLLTRRGVRETLSRLHPCTDLAEAAGGADFVVEAVSEDLPLKQEIFSALDRICPRRTILASDTSALPISQIASATSRPQKVIGTHFFNPPYLLPAVEVPRGNRTSPRTVAATRRLLRSIGKVPVVVNEVPAYAVARMTAAIRRELCSILEKGIVAPRELDDLWKMGVGRLSAALGPCEMCDLSGLDVLLTVSERVQKIINSSPVPCSLWRKKVERGELGVKSGKGFYRWTPALVRKAKERRDRALMKLLRAEEEGLR